LPIIGLLFSNRFQQRPADVVEFIEAIDHAREADGG
jgi:hypothetical protein